MRVAAAVALTLVLCSLAWAQEDSNELLLSENHSFAAPLQGPDYKIPHWEWGGDALGNPEFIRITQSAQSQSGYLWCAEQMMMHNWQIVMEFKVAGPENPGADGLAMWYVDEPAANGPVFGMADQFVGLGVFFDTYDNDERNNNPYVLAMVNDGTIKYDHENDGLPNKLAGCIADFRNRDKPSVVRLTYENRSLTLELDVRGRGRFERCMHVKEIHLPAGYWFGVTAATGHYADSHDVYSVRMYNLDNEHNAPSPDQENTPTANPDTADDTEVGVDPAEVVGSDTGAKSEEDAAFEASMEAVLQGLTPEMKAKREQELKEKVEAELQNALNESYGDEAVANESLSQVKTEQWEEIEEITNRLSHKSKAINTMVEKNTKKMHAVLEDVHYRADKGALSATSAETVSKEINNFSATIFKQLNTTLDRALKAVNDNKQTLQNLDDKLSEYQKQGSSKEQITSLDALTKVLKEAAALTDDLKMVNDGMNKWRVEVVKDQDASSLLEKEAQRTRDLAYQLSQKIKETGASYAAHAQEFDASSSGVTQSVKKSSGLGVIFVLIVVQFVGGMAYTYYRRKKDLRRMSAFPRSSSM
eukprot:GFYU01000439.1.p1 GENE.GFYU01000439.1~~GFYU01000439.1.p1  ORF type:complete len:588 (-),score=188.10 GFYU01000439.1:95-1858(-)